MFSDFIFQSILIVLSFADMKIPEDQKLVNSLFWTTVGRQWGERNVCGRQECSIEISSVSL